MTERVIRASLLEKLRTAYEACEAALHGTEPTFVVTDEDGDRVNAQSYEEARSLPLSAELAAFRSTQQQMLETIQTLSAADLATPGRFPWLRDAANRRSHSDAVA